MFLPVDGAYYRRVSRQIFTDIFSQVTDAIEQVSVDECYMDVSGALLVRGGDDRARTGADDDRFASDFGVTGDFERGEERVHVDVQHRAAAFVVPPVTIHECYMDVSGALLRWGSPTRIGAWLREQVSERFHITCSVGVPAGRTGFADVTDTNRNNSRQAVRQSFICRHSLFPNHYPGYISSSRHSGICDRTGNSKQRSGKRHESFH